MFKVKHKKTGEEYTVYSVRNDEDGAIFFLLFKHNKWEWMYGHLYKPA